jgi:hypothetical protein
MFVKHIETIAGLFTLAKPIMNEALEASETIVKVAMVYLLEDRCCDWRIVVQHM